MASVTLINYGMCMAWMAVAVGILLRAFVTPGVAMVVWILLEVITTVVLMAGKVRAIHWTDRTSTGLALVSLAGDLIALASAMLINAMLRLPHGVNAVAPLALLGSVSLSMLALIGLLSRLNWLAHDAELKRKNGVSIASAAVILTLAVLAIWAHL